MNSQEFQQWRSFVMSPISIRSFYLEKPKIMGVLNITPDSFSDGGSYLQLDKACHRAEEMISEGADIIDIGGESSRPKAIPISASEELKRVIPVIKRIREKSDIFISIDTYKPQVMEAAVAAGANMINDIKALTEKDALAVAAELKVPVCLMHMQGNSLSMQDNPHYENDVVNEINEFFLERIESSLQAGILRQNLILDPGFGFGKLARHNLTLINRLSEFHKYDLPLLLGVSRKSTIGTILNKDIDDRLIGGIAIAVYSALQGISILRTHDIDKTNQALKVIDAIVGANSTKDRNRSDGSSVAWLLATGIPTR